MCTLDSIVFVWKYFLEGKFVIFSTMAFIVNGKRNISIQLIRRKGNVTMYVCEHSSVRQCFSFSAFFCVLFLCGQFSVYTFSCVSNFVAGFFLVGLLILFTNIIYTYLSILKDMCKVQILRLSYIYASLLCVWHSDILKYSRTFVCISCKLL